MNQPTDDHPDGPDPIRDEVWNQAMRGLNRPAPRFGEITTDAKLDAVVEKNDQSKSVMDAGESIPASASSRRRLGPPPIHPGAMLVPLISPWLAASPDNEPEK